LQRLRRVIRMVNGAGGKVNKKEQEAFSDKASQRVRAIQKQKLVRWYNGCLGFARKKTEIQRIRGP